MAYMTSSNVTLSISTARRSISAVGPSSAIDRAQISRNLPHQPRKWSTPTKERNPPSTTETTPPPNTLLGRPSGNYHYSRVSYRRHRSMVDHAFPMRHGRGWRHHSGAYGARRQREERKTREAMPNKFAGQKSRHNPERNFQTSGYQRTSAIVELVP